MEIIFMLNFELYLTFLSYDVFLFYELLDF